MISNITIENIKGFGTSNNSFNLSIYPKKVNILVAPNGFGKSSITAAFASLKTNRLEVSIDDLHQNNQTLSPKLQLTIDGQVYTASPSVNELSSIVNCHIIRNRINAKATSKRMGTFHGVSSSLVIDDIEVVKTIPVRAIMPYSYSRIKHGFGKNGKILDNLSSLFNDTNYVAALDNHIETIKEILKTRNWRKIESLRAVINNAKGSSSEIKKTVANASLFIYDQAFRPLAEFVKSHYSNISDVDIALHIYQLSICYTNNKTDFNKTIKYKKYIKFKNELNQDIEQLGSTWKDIKAKEQNKSLVVPFPVASAISYGQRDLLTLIIQLKKFDLSINVNKKNILIIDEVFDYLDAVNMTVIQFYLSNYIQKWKSTCDFYSIIMTHLSPHYFNNYVFSNKQLNVQYLVEGRALPSERWRNFLSKRDDDTISADVSKYLLHFNPSFISGHREDFKRLKLPETWGEGDAFHKQLIDQINLYFSNSFSYDPYAVCIIVRIRIEKIVYDQLDSVNKMIFLNTRGTKKKLLFAEQFIDVPDLYYLLGVIYNDAEHIKNPMTDKPIIYRLDHTAIKMMIKRLFDSDRDVLMADIH